MESSRLINRQGKILLWHKNCNWNKKVHYRYYLSQVSYPLCELWSQINHQKQGDIEVIFIHFRGYEHSQPMWSVHQRNQEIALTVTFYSTLEVSGCLEIFIPEQKQDTTRHEHA